MTRNNALRCTIEGAIFVALAQLLGYLKFFSMPAGGSVSFIMLPIVVYSVRWGWKQGVLAGLALGVLQFALDFTFSIAWQSILLDYVLSYTLVGLAGLLAGSREGVFVGALLGACGRFVITWISGAVLYGDWMPETFLDMPMTNPWVYSAIYNMIPVGLSLIICLIVLAIIYKPLNKFLLGSDIR